MGPNPMELASLQEEEIWASFPHAAPALVTPHATRAHRGHQSAAGRKMDERRL